MKAGTTIARSARMRSVVRLGAAAALLGLSALAVADAPACTPLTEFLRHESRPELVPISAVESQTFAPGSITFVVLPDMQYYSECRSWHFASQMNWIDAQAAPRDIRAVLTLGDLTEHNSRLEWRYVRDGFRRIQDRLPIVLVSGNHDHGEDGSSNRRATLLDNYFPQPPGVAAQALAETRDRHDIENAYYRISLPHVTLGVLALEWAPRDSIVVWANEVLARHANDRVIILTHAYLYDDSTRYDWQAKGATQLWSPLHFANTRDAAAVADPSYDGQMLWDALVRKHSNVFLVMSGHVGGKGTGTLASRGDAGNSVQQVLVNFQMLVEGGMGYLRLVELLPDGKTVRMKTYSPSIDKFAGAADQNGEFTVEPALW